MPDVTTIDVVDPSRDAAMRRTVVRRRLFILLVGYWMAMFIATHIPVQHSPNLGESGLDKIAHFVGYGGLAFLLSAWLFTRQWSTPRIALAVLTVLPAYAVADELLQVVVARHTDVWDFVANVMGTAIGLAGAIVLRGLFRADGE